MELSKVLTSRKSIRSYTGEPVTDEEVKEILKAGYTAPVGRSAFASLQMTVVTNPELLNKINENCKVFFHNDKANPLYGAPMLIILSTPLTGTPQDNAAYSNAACIVENMALKAVELGLGSCHIWGAIAGLNTNPDLVKEFPFPEGHTPVCGIILGRTKEVYAEREIPDEKIKTVYVK